MEINNMNQIDNNMTIINKDSQFKRDSSKISQESIQKMENNIIKSRKNTKSDNYESNELRRSSIFNSEE